MMWHVVIPEWVALLNDDDALITALGGYHIYPASASKDGPEIPSVQYTTPIIDQEEELFNPFLIQVDYWVRGVARAGVVEERIRTLTHRDTARWLGGMRMWTHYVNSRHQDYPKDTGVQSRSLDFLFKPLKAKYAKPHESVS